MCWHMKKWSQLSHLGGSRFMTLFNDTRCEMDINSRRSGYNVRLEGVVQRSIPHVDLLALIFFLSFLSLAVRLIPFL